MTYIWPFCSAPSYVYFSLYQFSQHIGLPLPEDLLKFFVGNAENLWNPLSLETNKRPKKETILEQMRRANVFSKLLKYANETVYQLCKGTEKAYSCNETLDRSHLFSLREGFVWYLFFCFASNISRCNIAERAKWPFLFVKVTGIYFVLLLDGITYNTCSIKNRTIVLPNVKKQPNV